MDDDRPLLLWAQEAILREKYGLTTQDLQEMDWEQIDFFIAFADAQQREEQRQIEAKTPHSKTRR